MSKARLAIELACNLASPYPYFVQKQLSSELCAKVASISNRNDIDLVHFEWTPYAAATMRDRAGKPWVIDAHNVESLIWRRYFEVEKNWLKARFIHRQWKKTVQFERQMFQSASHTVFVSEPDQVIAFAQFGCRASTVVDNGVDIAGYMFSERTHAESATLLFLGSLDWRPNVDAIRWFLDEIWPVVRSKHPHAKLDIVGRNPSQSLTRRISTESQCAIHANVPDVGPFLKKASALVVPLRIGGGSRLKVLEAAASGVPVISTQVGIEGLKMDAGTHYLLADTAEQMIASALAICERKGEADLHEMAKSARRLVEDRYDWSSLSSKLASVWQSLSTKSGLVSR